MLPSMLTMCGVVRCTSQDFLQILSIFASFNFAWPPELTSLYHSLSLASFNLQLLAPECSFTINYADKWLVTAALPIVLVGAVLIVVTCTRLLQCVQSRILHVVAFGATGELSLTDVCVGILITGNYYLYFRTCRVPKPLLRSVDA